MTTITARIASTRIVGNSASGNPTHRVTLDDGREYLTEVDGAVSHDIRNHLGQPHLGRPAPLVELTIRRGRITHAREVVETRTVTVHGERHVLALVRGDKRRRGDELDPHDIATCGSCGRSWDDGQSTALTPAPSARCPFEYEH
jgi:hypothetical protein